MDFIVKILWLNMPRPIGSKIIIIKVLVLLYYIYIYIYIHIILYIYIYRLIVHYVFEVRTQFIISHTVVILVLSLGKEHI